MNQLAVFLKNPQKGKVKTRLAATTDQDFALDIYLMLLNYTASVISDLPYEKHIFYSDFIEENLFNGPYQKRLQEGDDLGEKMNNAINYLLKESGSSVVLIGADCPSITAEIIKDAFKELQHHDVVIGPAFDGGYYLIGMKKDTPEIFQNIQWSTDKVLSRTIFILNKMQLSYTLLPMLNDIDKQDDLSTTLW